MTSGHKLLHNLLQLWQRNPDTTRRKSLVINSARPKAKPYFEVVDPVAKDELHATLNNAERAGGIFLHWGKHFQSHLLKKIVLESPQKLAEFLGVPLAVEQAKGYRKDLINVIPEGFSWGDDLVEEIIRKWRVDASYLRIAPGDIDSVKTFFLALSSVQAEKHLGMDLRTFSAKFLGDSKIMENLSDRFMAVWNRFNSTDHLNSRDLYESLGLTKHPPAMLFKGPLKIHFSDSVLDISQVPSFVGVPPDLIDALSLSKPPEGLDYVLTVENLASFNRHCREIDDHGAGITIFSSGFLNPTAATVLRMLDTKLPATVKFFHWGDIDAGGLNIYQHIFDSVIRFVYPHLMNETTLKQFGRVDESSSFRTLSHRVLENDMISKLAEFSKNGKITLEQENVDPKLPALIKMRG